jgi:hypothetical protein
MPSRAERLSPSIVRIWGRGRGYATVALLPPAAFAGHQLRYVLAYGGRAGAEWQETGHSYLHSVVPWLVLLLALTAGGFLRALGRAFAGQTSASRYTASLAGLWLACSATLVAIFAGQEFLEGLFAAGHPTGRAGIFGYGGLWSIPAALCVGFVLAALLHGAHWVVRRGEEPGPGGSNLDRSRAVSHASLRCRARELCTVGRGLVGPGASPGRVSTRRPEHGRPRFQTTPAPRRVCTPRRRCCVACATGDGVRYRLGAVDR